MVALSTIIESNAGFRKAAPTDAVAVFMGATAGIGLATMKKMAGMLRSSTFYILGRSAPRFKDVLDQLREIGPSNRYVFIEGQVSLIADIDTACRNIASVERKVDYVFMSPGGFPWQGAVYTTEGMEMTLAITYYSRLRMVFNLLPLLHQSRQPRVLSVFNGTQESPINEHDIGLEKDWAMWAAIKHSTLLTSLAFDYLTASDSRKHIVFLHASPGVVNAGIYNTGPTQGHGFFWWLCLTVVKYLATLLLRIFGMSLRESSERQAFELTSDDFRPGSWRVDKSCDVVPDNEVLRRYQEGGWAEKIWEHTEGVWAKALTSVS